MISMKIKKIAAIALAVVALATCAIGANADSISFNDGKLVVQEVTQKSPSVQIAPSENVSDNAGGLSISPRSPAMVASENVDDPASAMTNGSSTPTVSFDFADSMNTIASSLLGNLTAMLPTALVLVSVGLGIRMLVKLIKKHAGDLAG